MQFLNANRLSFSVFLLLLLMSALIYGDIPDQVPTDFTMDGVARDTMSKDSLILLIPGSFVGVIVLANLFVSISPQKFSMPNSKHAIDIILFGIGGMLCFMHFALLMNNGDFEFYTRYLSYGLALFSIVVGNVFGKTERNFIIGLRLPWTIASAANWKATHRFAGRLMVGLGALLFISNSIIPNLWIAIVMITAPIVLAVPYSYAYYANHEEKTQAAE